MIYNNLILNKIVHNKLTSFIKMDHLPNAFIFHGDDGVGKEAHAIEFFALLNCKKPVEDMACGECPSCKKTKKIQHEYLNIIVPLPKSKSINKNDSFIKALSEKQYNDLIGQYIKKGSNP